MEKEEKEFDLEVIGYEWAFNHLFKFTGDIRARVQDEAKRNLKKNLKGDTMEEKHYVVRINVNGDIEDVFEGTFSDAINHVGVDCVDVFDNLLKKNYFGEGHYLEVTKEDYNEIKNSDQDRRKEILKRY